MSVCRDKIRPAIVPFFEVVRGVKDNNDVAIVRVTRGYDVHALWHNNINRYLMRVGTQSREASPEELARLFQQRGLIRAELRPVSGATLANLDRRRLHNYFGDIRGQDVPADGDEKAWQSLLINTEIMTEEGVAVGGMLLFGKTPNRFLPHAGIDAAAYPGTEPDYGAQERTALRGPMTPLLSAGGDITAVRQPLKRGADRHRKVFGGGRCAQHPQLAQGVVSATHAIDESDPGSVCHFEIHYFRWRCGSSRPCSTRMISTLLAVTR